MPITSVKNPADAVNVALVRIGWKGGEIGNLYDGSEAAMVALNIYGQTRDELLRSHAWDFAQRTISLSLLKAAPVGGYVPGFTPWDPTTDPPIPWLFEYAYPEDCIKIRAVKPVPIFLPNFDPLPNVFSTANDNDFTPAREVILTNVENSLCIYTARVTDPTTWTADFTNSFIDALGESLAPALTSLDAAKLEAAEGGASVTMAKMEQG
jgi:hypothetical protein